MPTNITLPRIPSPSPFFPKHAVDTMSIVNRLAAATITYGAAPGPVGAGAFVFGGENAVLALNLSPTNLKGPILAAIGQGQGGLGGISGTVALASLTPTGSNGSLTVASGIIIAYVAPT